MGLGRKVGAFLGLVPEDQGKYPEGEYGPEYDGHFEDDRSYEYDRRGYAAAGDTEFEARGRYDDHDRYEERDSREATRYPEGGFDRQRPTVGLGGGGRRPFDTDAAPVQGALAVKPEPAPPVRVVEPISSNRPTTVRLTGFGEARLIGEKYRDGQSVILDMTDMSDSDARRLVDFSAGLAFALRGSIDKVAPKVFMLLPPHADVSAAAADYHAGHADR